MKNLIIFLITSSAFISCKPSEKPVVEKEVQIVTQQKPTQIVEFAISQLKIAVLSQNKDSIIQKLDRNYVQEQLVKFLKENKVQFLNELFCGKDKLNNFKCIDYNKITDIKLIDSTPKENGYSVNIQVKTVENTIKTYLFLKVSNQNKILGFVGSVG